MPKTYAIDSWSLKNYENIIHYILGSILISTRFPGSRGIDITPLLAVKTTSSFNFPAVKKRSCKIYQKMKYLSVLYGPQDKKGLRFIPPRR